MQVHKKLMGERTECSSTSLLAWSLLFVVELSALCAPAFPIASVLLRPIITLLRIRDRVIRPSDKSL